MLIGIPKYNKKSPLIQGAANVSDLKVVENDILTLYKTLKYDYKLNYVRISPNFEFGKNSKDFAGVKYLDRQSIDVFTTKCATEIDNNISKGEIDCFILFYAGHGYRNEFDIDSDGRVFEFYDIVMNFDSTRRKSMQHLPKLIFYDCCRNAYLSQEQHKQFDNKTNNKTKSAQSDA